jgi:hypothetical protein
VSGLKIGTSSTHFFILPVSSIDCTFDTHCYAQIRSFTNHACDGNNNIGVKLGVSQSSANPQEVAQEIIERYKEPGVTYNPAADRQVKSYARSTTLQDIKQGEEHLDNYLASSGNCAKKWENNVAELRKVCEGASE